MKKIFLKLSSSFFMGIMVMGLAACDKAENKAENKVSTPETQTEIKAVENKASPDTAPQEITSKEVNKTDATLEAQKTQNGEQAASEEKSAEKTTALSDNETVKNTEISTSVQDKKTEAEKGNVQNTSNSSSNEENTAAEVNKKTKPKKAASSHVEEQMGILAVLQEQYEKVRCTSAATNLTEESFCRQEERRLLSEMEKIRAELK